MIASLHIEHTVPLALTRMGRFIARLPAYMGAPFDPKEWLPMASKAAEEVLMVIATPEQQPFVPLFIKTILVEDKGLGMDWKMEAPQLAMDLDVQAAADLATGGQLFLMANSETTSRLVDTIAKWVATEKNKALKGDRDDSVVVARILRILRQADVKSPVPGTVGGGVVLQSKAEGLIRRLQEFADRAPGLFTAPVLNEWMESVLIAWSELVVSMLPARLRSAIQHAWE